MALAGRKAVLTRMLNQLIEAVAEGKQIREQIQAHQGPLTDDRRTRRINILSRKSQQLNALAGKVAEASEKLEEAGFAADLSDELHAELENRIQECGDIIADGYILATELASDNQFLEQEQNRLRVQQEQMRLRVEQEQNRARIHANVEQRQIAGEREAPQDNEPDVEDEVQSEGSTASARSQMAALLQALDERNRLPRISTPTFSGEAWEWENFWTLFNENVHSRKVGTLEKFHHLLSALKGEAKECIKGYRVTADNYPKAISRLTDKYGDNKVVIHDLFQQYEKLKSTGSKAKEQRRLLDEIVQIHEQLQDRGENLDGGLHANKVLAKFQAKIQREVLKKHNNADLGSSWTMKWLLEALEKVIAPEEEIERAMETLRPESKHDSSSDHNRKHERKPENKATKNGKFSKCFFCGSDHKPQDCTVVMAIEERERRMKADERCLNCGKKGHFASDCRSTFRCKCGGKHHTSICKAEKKTTTKNEFKPANQWSNEGKSANGTQKSKPVTQNFGKSGGKSQKATTNVVAEVKADNVPFDEANALHLQGEEKKRSRQAAILVGTAKVFCPKLNKLERVPVLIDSGSNVSFILDEYADEIGAAVVEHRKLAINTFGSREQQSVHEIVRITIFDETDEAHRFELFKSPIVTSAVTQPKLSKADWKFIKEHQISLSRAPDGASVRPKLLIGMDQLYKIHTMAHTLPTGLQLMATKLGHVVGGTQFLKNEGEEILLPENELTTMTVHSAVETDENQYHLELQQRFVEDTSEFNCQEARERVLQADSEWAMIPHVLDEFTGTEAEEKRRVNAQVLEDFERTVERREDGYYVRIPWKENHPLLPDNRTIAFRRLESVLRFLKERPEVKKLYHATFQEQLEKGILEVVRENEGASGPRVHFLAHQPVITPHKDTTKLRVVFDASAHFKEKPSLNQVVNQGPTILPDLVDLLIRFRLNDIVVLSDVEKAFLQVRLQEEDRDACRCLWVKDPNLPATPDNIVIFRFSRVTFGINASPFLLAATIKHHIGATECLTEDLKAEVAENLYVDNLLLTTNSPDEAVAKYGKVKQFFGELNMNLREFMSNSEKVRSQFDERDRATNSCPKVLGIPWHCESDRIAITVDFPYSEILTKRVIAKKIHSIYDPLGFLIPVMFDCKLFMQKLWKLDYNWDDHLRNEHADKWEKLEEEAWLFHNSYLPRKIGRSGAQMKLVAFSDASSAGMASCIYLVEAGFEGNLVKAKSKLQPVMTIPKMELHALTMAVSEGVKVFNAIKNTIKITEFFVFSDSEISLDWVKQRPEKRECGVLVQNRVTSIRKMVLELAELGVQTKFGHIESENNPADCATRGLSRSEVRNFLNHIWFTGPHFLRDPENEWPEENQCVLLPEDETGEDEHQVSTVTASYEAESELVDFSRISRKGIYHGEVLQANRRLVYVLRFIKKLCKKAKSERLQEVYQKLKHMKSDGLHQNMHTAELFTARDALVRYHQMTHLPEDAVKQMPNLNAQKDRHGVLRCNGRMGKSSQPWETQRPILLARKTALAAAVIRDAHLMNDSHTGTAQTMAKIREEFWIPKLRQQVNSIVHKCIPCQKDTNLPYKYPKMGDLPSERVTRTRPFSAIGLDYFGPLSIRKNGEEGTAFGCIMTCMTTRLVHLELVPDGTTTSFLNAMRRFFSRRGVPKKIWCDNAPTFLLGEEILKDTINAWHNEAQVKNDLFGREIEWRHITPYAPWQGGMYERLIKTVKSCMYKVIGKKTLDFDSLATVLIEVEAVVNQRPLTYQEERWEDQPILRPIDFIQNEMVLSIPQVPATEMDGDPDYLPPAEAAVLRTRNQTVSAVHSSMELTERFWKIWNEQYLTALRERHKVEIDKKRGKREVPRVGAFVLIMDPLIPRHRWRTARIIEVKASPDGHIREVTVKTPQGRILSRPVNLVVPFEIDGTEYQDNPEEVEDGLQEVEPQKEPAQRYNLRQHPRVNYTEEREAEVLQVQGISAKAENKLRKGWSVSLPNLSTVLFLLTIIGLCLPTSAAQPASVNFANVTGSLRCSREGVMANTSNVKSMQMCSDGFCQEWTDPKPIERLKLPAEITLHDYSVQWKVSDGEEVSSTQLVCRASAFCQAIDCTFCVAHVFNPECSPTTAILTVGVIIYILIMGIYACLYVPVVVGTPVVFTGKGLLSLLRLIGRSIRGCFKYCYRHCRKKSNTEDRLSERRERILKELLIAVVAASLIGSTNAQCLDIDVFSHTSTKCLEGTNGTECSVETSEVLKMSPFQNEACLRLYRNETLIKHMHIRLAEVLLTCDEETITFTRDVQTKVLSSKRCPKTGSCTDDKCSAVNDTTLLPELAKGNTFPGRTGCSESCGGPGCDCFFLSSGCLFYRIFAMPVDDNVYRIFSCQRWKESVKVVIEDSSKIEFMLIPLVAETKDGITSTLSSLTIPPLSILQEKFITDSKGTAIWRSDRKPTLSCTSEKEARKLSCAVLDDCECHPAEVVMNCRCTDVSIGKQFVDLQNHLPIVAPGMTTFVQDGQLQIRVDNLVTAEIVVHLHEKFDMENEITDGQCSVDSVSVSGCYRCQKGAMVDFVCSSKTDHRTAQIECGNTAFRIPCSRKGTKSQTRIAANNAQLNMECTIECGRSRSNFQITGILKFTTNFEETAKKWRQGEINSFWDISWPDWKHLLDVYWTWYKTVILTVMGVAVAVLLTYLYVITCGWRTLASITKWLAKKMGQMVMFPIQFFRGPRKNKSAEKLL